jgi:threonyl-tRNA synthetase
MLHRAILGSLERFVGILIEHHGGAFPFWLAPVQVAIATIVDDGIEYAKEVQKLLEAKGIRVETDFRAEQISYKVREHSHQKIPVILAIGKQEVEKRTVAVRRFGSQKQEFVGLDEFISGL